MIEVIGVRFRTAGKVYYFSPAGCEIKRGDYCIVETARGVEMGKVVMPSKLVEDEEVVQPLKDILRVATPEDIEQSAINRAKEKSAFHVCKEKIRNHGLEMKLIDAEYTFDGTKLLFYFTADGRIDFRELVKDLASVFKVRIELRQIGVRDETKILGGLGICGRVLCCHSYLSDFAPVSIKMAKEQNLSLNPTKISGTCGRLMCCLKNEEDTYEELNRKLPSVNDYVKTKEGITGQVQSTDVLRQKVRILIEKGDEKELVEYSVDDITFHSKKGRANVQELTPEEEALKVLEDDNIVEETTVKKANHKPHKQHKSRNSEKRPEVKEAQKDDTQREERKEGTAKEHSSNHKNRNRRFNNRNRQPKENRNGEAEGK